MKILVTGGAGYVGSVLVPDLLAEGHEVRVLDDLSMGGRGLLPCFRYQSFEFRKGDVREQKDLAACLEGVDAVIHLAAVVGAPACKKDPKRAQEVNLDSTRLLDELRSPDQAVLFASTGSNYGAVVGEVCTEETPLNPLTEYGRTKTEAEQLLLEAGNAVCYRFATAFGVSNRLRLDLLVNDFCYQAKRNRNLILYEKGYKRTFIHVRDMSRSFLFALDNLDRMLGEAYNVGHESMNYSKEDVAVMIREKVDYYLHFAEIGHDEDQRNYEVSYKKIRDLGFETTISLEEGIEELLRAIDVVEISNEFSNV